MAMALMKKKTFKFKKKLGYQAILIVLVFLNFCFLHAGYAQTLTYPPERPDKDSVKAFQEFWRAFDEYERKLIKEGQKKYQKNWNALIQKYNSEKKESVEGQIKSLKSSIESYRNELQAQNDSQNKYHIAFNLSQVYLKLASLLKEVKSNESLFYISQALNLLREISERAPDFVYWDRVQYLRAIALEDSGRSDDAIKVWQNLAQYPNGTMYVVQAHIAIGDFFFESEKADQALSYYSRAHELILALEISESSLRSERIRILYRIAWSAYRSAKLAQVVAAGAELLKPGILSGEVEQAKKISTDVVELVGDALFESGSFVEIKKYLAQKDISFYAPMIGLRIMQRYGVNGAYEDSSKVGAWVVQKHPMSEVLPDLLDALAVSYQKQGKQDGMIHVLEQLALIFPSESLWRLKYKENYKLIERMEDLAERGARQAARYYYETGLSTGQPQFFISAISFYQILLDKMPNHSDANMWRLRTAHCYYFSERLSEAAQIYAALKEDFKVSPEILEIAAYQQVLTQEKIWRAAFGKALDKGQDPEEEEETKESLIELEKSIDEFVNRFPEQNRSVDLLLVGASANRDQEMYERANRYWQRVLVSKPNSYQRSTAIRGMVAVQIKMGSSMDVIETTRRFLRMEDWNFLGQPLNTELKNILAKASIEEGERLGDQGKVKEAGELLVSIGQEFQDLPSREKIYRDGAYFLAIGGEWYKAHDACENYLSENLQQFSGDILYLKGRAEEFQIKFPNAVASYLKLAETNPGHPQSLKGLERAEQLSVADNSYDSAGKAAQLLGDRMAAQEQRFEAYQRAFEYYMSGEFFDSALQVANRMERVAQSRGLRLKANLNRAKSQLKQNQNQIALTQIRSLVVAANNQRGSINQKEYASVVGEAEYILAEEERDQFVDYQMLERSGSISARVATKAKYFENLALHYDSSAATESPDWAPKSRHRLATTAELFAEELGRLKTQNTGKLSFNETQEIDKQINRLYELSKKYHSHNALAKTKDPSSLEGNEWIRKSEMKLAVFGGGDQKKNHQDHIPSSTHYDLPQSWSH